MQTPLPDHWNTSNALQYATFVRNPARSCIYCQWVDVRILIPPKNGYTRGLSCTNPKCHRGQAGEGKDCCSFTREPGADDELDEG